MSMSQDALLALARSLSGKGNVSSSDINTLLSPEVGYLTGSFYGQEGGDEEDDEFMYLKYAPNFRAAMNLTDDNIRKIIANELAQGAAPWDVRRQIEEYTAAQANANPGLINQEGETKDLLSFADKVYGEINSFSVASQEKSRKASANDPFAAGGIPSPYMDFGMDKLAPDMFDMLSKQSQALQADTRKFQARGKSRAAALEFLKRGSGSNFDPYKDKLPEYEGRSYPEFATGGGGGQITDEQANFAKQVEGYQKDYLVRVAEKNRLSKNPSAWKELYPQTRTYEQAVALAQKGVDVYKKIFDDSVAGAKKNLGMYTPEKLANPKGEDRSFQRAEDIRFGRPAQGVVDRSQNVAQDVKDTAAKSKWMQDYSSALDMLLKAKARQVGFTPYEEALTARSNFLRSGGL
jgi:hypothetical protein